MARRKTKAEVHITDGAGGMVPVDDLRFEGGEWPIIFEVPGNIADSWIAHLNAECSERAWPNRSLSELETQENSGTITVDAGPAGKSPSLEIVWERPRGDSIKVRARCGGTPTMTVEDARGFLDAVTHRCQTGKMDRRHRRWFLRYKGLRKRWPTSSILRMGGHFLGGRLW